MKALALAALLLAGGCAIQQPGLFSVVGGGKPTIINCDGEGSFNGTALGGANLTANCKKFKMEINVQ